MTKIKTIFFDLGGVLLELREGATVKTLAERAGLAPEVVENAFPLDEYYRYERGEMDETAFFAVWRDAIGSEVLTDSDFTSAWDRLVGDELETVALMERLLPHYQVYILSNTNDYHIRSLTPKYNLFNKVDGTVYSYKLGCRKPEARIFELALEQAGTTAAESVFIDDMEVNVAAAAELGVHAIHFTGVADLKIELKLLGIRGID